MGERLLEREATARGMTRNELLAADVSSRIPYVTDAEIKQTYKRDRNRFGDRTFEEAQDRIRAMLERQRSEQALQNYIHDLRRTADDVEVLIAAPRQVVETLAEDPARGLAATPVEIVEFSDFDCPYCKRAADTIVRLLDEFGDRIRFVYKDFPLPRHPNAFKAAEAGNCANDQDRFWEMHDRMLPAKGRLMSIR